MAINREILEREIVGSKAAIKAHIEGAEINEIALQAFEEAIKRFPEKKKEKKIPSGVN